MVGVGEISVENSFLRQEVVRFEDCVQRFIAKSNDVKFGAVPYMG
jgi:hypothetical protein